MMAQMLSIQRGDFVYAGLGATKGIGACFYGLAGASPRSPKERITSV